MKMRRKKTTRKSSRMATRTSTTRARRTSRRRSRRKSRATSAATGKCSRKSDYRPSSRIAKYISDSQNALIMSQCDLNEIYRKPKKRGTSSCSLFDYKDYFPQQLRNYIDILNELFNRQNDIINSGAHPRIDNLRESITFPPIVEIPRAEHPSTRQYIDEKQSLSVINGEKYSAKLKEDRTIRYLTGRHSSRRRSAKKDYIVAMATKGTKKERRKTGSGRRSSMGGGKSAKSKKGTAGGTKDGKKAVDNAGPQPILKYQLSDLEYLKNGMTAVPNETLIGKIISFRAEAPKPLIHAFRERVEQKVYYYGPDHVAATFNTNGTGLVSYPNGETAIQINEGRLGKRLVVYSQSGKDENGIFHGNLPLAIFDNFGNGAVFDINGKIRLNYDQGEGVLYDTRSKLPIYWQWSRSQFLIQRKKDLEFAPEDLLDNDVPDTPIVYDTIDEDAGKKKKKGKTAGGKSAKGSAKTAKSGRKESKKGDRKQSAKGTAKETAKKGSKKGKSAKKEDDNDQKTKTSGKNKDDAVDTSSLASNKWNIKVLVDPKTLDRARNVVSLLSKEESLLPITDMKPLVMKITKNISLKILHQEHIHIDFLFTPVYFSLNIGAKIYPEFLERIDKIIRKPDDKRKVPCYFEFLNKRTYSLHDLHEKRLEMIAAAKRERIKKQVKNAYIMGTYILKKKGVAVEQPVKT